MAGSDCQLGEWIVRPRRDCIERGGEAVHVKPKAMDVLQCLIEGQGEVVSRPEIFDRVWPGGQVSDATLTQCVVELRQAFGDSARQPDIIETVPKVGFRLIPQVEPLESKNGTSAANRAGRRFFRPGTVLLLALLLPAGAWLTWWLHSSTPGTNRTASQTPTLAVLPFEDLSAARDQEWFADGLSDEIIHRLARLDGLRVTGRTSSFHFKYKEVEVHDIGATLGVAHVLDGSVRREGDQLRITAQLLETTTGYSLWSEAFDVPLSGIFDVQQEIAEAVATALSIRLGVGELGNYPGGTSSVEAFQRYLVARSLFVEHTAASMLEAIALLKQALEIDPEYADAWLWLSQFYKMAPMAIDDRFEQDWISLAEDALNEARRLDPTLPDLLGMQLNHLTHARDWSGAQAVFEQIETMDEPADAKVLFFQGLFLGHVGRAREALAYFRSAALLDPLAGHISRLLAHALLVNGAVKASLEAYERSWEIDNTIRRKGSAEGLNAALASKEAAAIGTWLTRALDHADTAELPLYEAMRNHLGDVPAATAWLRNAFEENDWEVLDHSMAVWAAYYGETTLALEFTRRSPNTWLIWLPQFPTLRRLPEFGAIVDELGLVSYWREHGWADFCRPVSESDFICE